MHILEVQALATGRSLIRTIPDPVLGSRSSDVEEFDAELRELAAMMLRELDRSNGIGLAAPQIGVLRRVIAYRSAPDAPGTVLVNPVIREVSPVQSVALESCLSIPEREVSIMRPELIEVEALDLNGTQVRISADQFSSRVIQHELDHLDGVLITDYLGY